MRNFVYLAVLGIDVLTVKMFETSVLCCQHKCKLLVSESADTVKRPKCVRQTAFTN